MSFCLGRECFDFDSVHRGENPLMRELMFRQVDCFVLHPACPDPAAECFRCAGVAHWINTFYHLKGDFAIDKGHPLVSCIKELVDREYDGGRITVMTDAELVQIIEDNKLRCGIDLPTVDVDSI